MHPCRASVAAVLKWRPSNKKSRVVPNGSPARSVPLLAPSAAPRNETIGELRFAVITTAIIILSFIVAMTVSSLDKVLGYVGSTGSTSISFILPGLFYYKISAPDSPHHQRLAKENDDDYERVNQDDGVLTGSQTMSRRHWREALLRNLALALAIYGMMVMAVCLVITTILNVKH